MARVIGWVFLIVVAVSLVASLVLMAVSRDGITSDGLLAWTGALGASGAFVATYFYLLATNDIARDR